MPLDDQKKIKRIAAVIYVLVMLFLVGGSYLHQSRLEADRGLNELGSPAQ